MTRGEFIEYLCEKYALEKERIGVFSGANIACFTAKVAATVAAAEDGGGGGGGGGGDCGEGI